ncbi:hypothetical protein SCLCIDRAFT_877398 [Scleroderma citrinum Foug A]|uniref:Uncharacterized protein n=1 Tax=Scleroderma citrinum Foug A TaxID=1036808 RepID=A0A0C3A9K2_9AGAM|nr:hypothetical protein SCLCIDRAFT_877398 [Scleroderma citrinum Foug A]
MCTMSDALIIMSRLPTDELLPPISPLWMVSKAGQLISAIPCAQAWACPLNMILHFICTAWRGVTKSVSPRR